MKLKIFLAPVLLILIVAGSIWVLHPAYVEMQAKKAALAAETEKLNDIKTKNAKAEAAYGVWNSNPEKRNIIMTYIPAQQQEEEVIDNLNSLAAGSGLAVYDLSVTIPEKAKAAATAAVDEAGNQTEEVSAAPVADNFSATVGVSGDYGKIKTFLGKVNVLGRFNSISSLEISKANAPTGPDGKAVDNSGSGNLKADITLNFNWLNANNLTVTVNNKAFASDNFDMTVADAIRSQMTTGMQALNVGLAGRENPFVK